MIPLTMSYDQIITVYCPILEEVRHGRRTR